MNRLSSSFPGPVNGPCVTGPAATYALICLHGFGSSGDDLIALAPALHATLGNLAESLAVYAPHAPSRTPDGYGHQWFRDMGWTFRDEPGLQTAARQLDAFIGHVAEAHGIPSSRIILLGFSQGAMTVLYALPRLANQPAAAVACSGALTLVPEFPPPAAAALPPLLFLHGEDDDVLPADTSVRAAETFANQDYTTELHILPGLGHGLDATALAHLSVFLQNIMQNKG